LLVLTEVVVINRSIFSTAR